MGEAGRDRGVNALGLSLSAGYDSNARARRSRLNIHRDVNVSVAKYFV